jgi:Cellulase M and related proteins
VDVTSALDYTDPHLNALELGKGPAIKVMDGGMITNIELRNELIEVSKKTKSLTNLKLLLVEQQMPLQCR